MIFTPARRLGTNVGLALLALACSSRREDIGAGHAAVHVAATPVLGPEIELSPPVYTDRSEEQVTPAVAAGRGVSLVVWWHKDSERPRPDRIYGARVSPEGKVLDPLGFLISEADAEHEIRPQVAWNGTVFFVLWSRQVGNDLKLRGVRVTPEGKVLDTVSIDVASEARTHETPFLATDGHDFLVVYRQVVTNAESGTIRSRLVRADGTVDPASAAPLVAPEDQPVLRALGSNGKEYLFVHTRRDVGLSWRNVARRLDARGVPLGAPVDLDDEAMYGWYAGVAFDGARYLVCWTRYPPGTDVGGSVLCRRLDGAGQRMEPTPIVLSTNASAPHAIYLGWTGASYALVWDQPEKATALSDLFGRRVTSDGQPIDPDQVPSGL